MRSRVGRDHPIVTHVKAMSRLVNRLYCVRYTRLRTESVVEVQGLLVLGGTGVDALLGVVRHNADGSLGDKLLDGSASERATDSQALGHGGWCDQTLLYAA